MRVVVDCIVVVSPLAKPFDQARNSPADRYGGTECAEHAEDQLPENIDKNSFLMKIKNETSSNYASEIAVEVAVVVAVVVGLAMVAALLQLQSGMKM